MVAGAGGAEPQGPRRASTRGRTCRFAGRQPLNLVAYQSSLCETCQSFAAAGQTARARL